jgi:hypothetical protein
VLQTINGFDLLLILIIVGLIYQVMKLNQECESYVRQILQVSWELQSQYDKENPPYGTCVYCIDLEEKITGNECICELS